MESKGYWQTTLSVYVQCGKEKWIYLSIQVAQQLLKMTMYLKL